MEKSGKLSEGTRLATGNKEVIKKVSVETVLKVGGCLLSSLLFIVAFPPFKLPEAAYIFAIPILLLGLYFDLKRRDKVLVFFMNWLGWAGVLFWISHYTHYMEHPLSGLLGYLSLLGLSFIVSLFTAVWYLLALYFLGLAKRRTTIYRLVIMFGLSGFWICLEWLRSVLFTGFPWMPLSASQWQRPLILQIASWTGHYGISFILILFNLGLAFYLLRIFQFRKASWLKRISPEFYSAIGILAFSISFGLLANPGISSKRDQFSVGFVQPAVEGAEKWDQKLASKVFNDLERLHILVSYLKPDLVLWPEAPTPFPVKGDNNALSWTNQIIRNGNIPVLLGNIAKEIHPNKTESDWYNAVFVGNPETGVDLDNYYAKRKLVPFGEYIPMENYISFLSKVVPLPESFNKGKKANVLSLTIKGIDYKIGALVCYEDIFPSLARDLVLEGADFYFVTTNDNWFGKLGAAEQHAAHSVLRAVELRRPFLRCGNAGWSGWIDENGNIRHVMTDKSGSVYFEGVEAADVSISRYWNGRLTFYARHGDWFVGFCALLVLPLFWRTRETAL